MLQVTCLRTLAMFLPSQVTVPSDLERLFDIPRNKITHDRFRPCLLCASTTIHIGPNRHVFLFQGRASRLRHYVLHMITAIKHMPGMQMKHIIFGPSFTNSIGSLNRLRCTPLLYFNETILLKSAKGPKLLRTTSILDWRRDSYSLGFQSFTQRVKVCSACCIRI